MSKKRSKIIVTESRVAHVETGTEFQAPTVESLMRASFGEMEEIRNGLVEQQTALLERRAQLASAVKTIDEHLEIISTSLRMIEANQR